MSKRTKQPGAVIPVTRKTSIVISDENRVMATVRREPQFGFKADDAQDWHGRTAKKVRMKCALQVYEWCSRRKRYAAVEDGSESRYANAYDTPEKAVNARLAEMRRDVARAERDLAIEREQLRQAELQARGVLKKFKPVTDAVNAARAAKGGAA